jgi:hypothetical protein
MPNRAFFPRCLSWLDNACTSRTHDGLSQLYRPSQRTRTICLVLTRAEDSASEYFCDILSLGNEVTPKSFSAKRRRTVSREEFAIRMRQ